MKKFGVYEYDMPEVATNDELDESVKVKWLRIDMDTPTDADVRCRLVTEELVFSQRIGRVDCWNSFVHRCGVDFASQSQRRRRQEQGIMVLDVKCAFFCSDGSHRRVYIDIPRQSVTRGS